MLKIWNEARREEMVDGSEVGRNTPLVMAVPIWPHQDPGALLVVTDPRRKIHILHSYVDGMGRFPDTQRVLNTHWEYMPRIGVTGGVSRSLVVGQYGRSHLAFPRLGRWDLLLLSNERKDRADWAIQWEGHLEVVEPMTSSARADWFRSHGLVVSEDVIFD